MRGKGLTEMEEEDKSAIDEAYSNGVEESAGESRHANFPLLNRPSILTKIEASVLNFGKKNRITNHYCKRPVVFKVI